VLLNNRKHIRLRGLFPGPIKSGRKVLDPLKVEVGQADLCNHRVRATEHVVIMVNSRIDALAE